MNLNALLGMLALLYAAAVFGISIKQPKQIWGMKKIQMFEKVLGHNGTLIFFYIWGALFVGLGIWLFIK